MTHKQMTMAEASRRLEVLASSHASAIAQHGDVGQWLVSTLDLEAVTVAAGVLRVLTDALEAEGVEQ